MFKTAMVNPSLYKVGGWFMRKSLRLLYALGLSGSVLDPLRPWNKGRSTIPLAKQSFRAIWKKELDHGE
jgi:Domain of unknown function (DUF3390)